jgi:Fcf2 pre-rRNA processing
MYKKQGSFKIPEYSQIGTIIEGPTEFFSSRLSKAERTKSFLEETMVAETKSKRFKSKYTELQKRQRSGKKAFYKLLVAKRKNRSK